MPLIYDFLAMALREKDGIVRTVLRSYFNQVIRTVERVIDVGVANGELRDVDPFITAAAFVSGLEGAVVVWTYDPDIIDLDKQISANCELLIKGISRGEGHVCLD